MSALPIREPDFDGDTLEAAPGKTIRLAGQTWTLVNESDLAFGIVADIIGGKATNLDVVNTLIFPPEREAFIKVLDKLSPRQVGYLIEAGLESRLARPTVPSGGSSATGRRTATKSRATSGSPAAPRARRSA